jgi:hypothetical protein
MWPCGIVTAGFGSSTGLLLGVTVVLSGFLTRDKGSKF